MVLNKIKGIFTKSNSNSKKATYNKKVKSKYKSKVGFTDEFLVTIEKILNDFDKIQSSNVTNSNKNLLILKGIIADYHITQKGMLIVSWNYPREHYEEELFKLIKNYYQRHL